MKIYLGPSLCFCSRAKSQLSLPACFAEQEVAFAAFLTVLLALLGL